ncbi:uncharacterized protein LY89DRAFT_672307 [Mollisia scopiformis]|uniref:Uncharacterized protein n=1 Tax=Mollisia scopiformis TaxID=149040 RepID=A0A194X1H9_MOLSC|nr:uncharacterized protein LY89DRAFT_672307 [Mollisia scopiformis]KUJ14048.1 hypothetical protein LY89DRAFT_672307 [Mollisia scopiformis]
MWSSKVILLIFFLMVPDSHNIFDNTSACDTDDIDASTRDADGYFDSTFSTCGNDLVFYDISTCETNKSFYVDSFDIDELVIVFFVSIICLSVIRYLSVIHLSVIYISAIKHSANSVNKYLIDSYKQHSLTSYLNPISNHTIFEEGSFNRRKSRNWNRRSSWCYRRLLARMDTRKTCKVVPASDREDPVFSYKEAIPGQTNPNAAEMGVAPDRAASHSPVYSELDGRLSARIVDPVELQGYDRY